LGKLPETLSLAVRAFIAQRRLEQFLMMPEKSAYVKTALEQQRQGWLGNGAGDPLNGKSGVATIVPGTVLT